MRESDHPLHSDSVAIARRIQAVDRPGKIITMPTTTPSANQRSSISSSERWIMAIGIWKLLEAALFIVLGIGALKLLHKDLVDVVTRFVIDLGRDPEGHFVNILLEKVALIDPHRLKQISLAIFAGAALHLLEGIGLVMRKIWAEYVTLVLTASFLPWELFEILRHVTWLKIVLTILNFAVVVYLVFHVQMKARQRKANAVE
jgi:uncharacterized membrane protein (DUF2068 family)